VNEKDLSPVSMEKGRKGRPFLLVRGDYCVPSLLVPGKRGKRRSYYPKRKKWSLRDLSSSGV